MLYLQIIQTAFIVVGVIVAVISFRADHKRRKRQATLEVFDPISEEMVELRHAIRDVFGNEIIYPSDTRYKQDRELQRKITRYLGLYERLSVGINLDVLDIDVFMRISGKSTLKWYNRLEPIIMRRRTKWSNPNAYKDFEILSDRIKAKYDNLYKKESGELINAKRNP